MYENDPALLCDRAVVSLANGDKDALGVIYDAMARNIYFAAYAITLNHADAEDVLQDTMLQLIRYAPSYRPGTNARAFILTVARHRALDTVRRRRPTVSIEDSSVAEIPSFDEGESVRMLLSLLNEQERQLVIFRLYEELSFAEIALIMKISIAAAQKRYQRALKKLKNTIYERNDNNERKRMERDIPSI